MDKLEDTIKDIKSHKEALGEWKRTTTAEFEEVRNEMDRKLGELHEWKRQWDDTKASEFMRHVQKTTYVRWGRTSCPGNGSESVYDGFAGGSHYSHKGASSMLCLPKDPDWDAGKTSDKSDPNVGYIYGAEYHDGSGRSDQLFGESHQNHDVPCVVCDVTKRSTVIMVPGRSKCYPGWTLEYAGYLMSGHINHEGATDYYCIDKDPENLPDAGSGGYLLYFVEAACSGSLRCPPYVSYREFQCAVCTK